MIGRALFLLSLLISIQTHLSAQVKAELEQSRLKILQQIEKLEQQASTIKNKIEKASNNSDLNTDLPTTTQMEFTLDTSIVSDEQELKELLHKYYISSLHNHSSQDDHLAQVYVKYILKNHESLIKIDTIWPETKGSPEQVPSSPTDNNKLKDLTREYNETTEELKAYQLSYQNINRTLDFLLYGGQENQNNLSVQNNSSSSSFAKEKGFHHWPMTNSRITKRFGNTVHPDHAHITISNNGLDLSSSSGEVQNIFDGTVMKVEQNTDGTYIIIIAHDGNYNSVYTELTNTYVSEGQEVSGRTTIGQARAGKNGKKLMHFEIWEGAQVQNPLHWLKNN